MTFSKFVLTLGGTLAGFSAAQASSGAAAPAAAIPQTNYMTHGAVQRRLDESGAAVDGTAGFDVYDTPTDERLNGCASNAECGDPNGDDDGFPIGFHFCFATRFCVKCYDDANIDPTSDTCGNYVERCGAPCDARAPSQDTCEDASASWFSSKDESCGDIFAKNEEKGWKKKKAKKNCKKAAAAVGSVEPVKAKVACACGACDKSRFVKKEKKGKTKPASVEIVVPSCVVAVFLVFFAYFLLRKTKSAKAQRRLSHSDASMPKIGAPTGEVSV